MGPELAVGAVVRRGDALLLVRRGTEPARGQWSLPGGRVERGESMSAAVERELAEETGLAGTCGELIGWVERISEAHHFVIADFAVQVPEDGVPCAGDDADEARFVAFDDLHHLDLVDGLLDFLAQHAITPAPTPKFRS